MSDWYAVYCKPQQDARAEINLRNQSYEVFRPLAQIRCRYGNRFRKVMESMFPRYLFIRLDDLVSWTPIRSTRGVEGLVRWGEYAPRVPNSVINELFARAKDGNRVDIEVGDFEKNQVVRILEGPLSGCQALFDRRSGEERVIVLLEMMRQVQRLVLPEQAIEPI